MTKIPEIKPTVNFLGRITCRKCKAKITTETLLYHNGDIYCLDCGEKVLKQYGRDLKAAKSNPSWQKFLAACENAYSAALEASGTIDDGGTCNLDSTFIKWPRLNETAFNIVMESSCLNGYKTKWLGSMGVIIVPPNSGQANKRSKAAEAMTRTFREFGYTAQTWYQMD